MIYEEPVEGGITRFIVIYQCKDAPRVEPVRSGRLVDPDVLVQFGRPLFSYAGGIQPVKDKVAKAGLIDVNYLRVRGYHRDPTRAAPHNLYTSTNELYSAANVHEGPPEPVFTFSRASPGGKRAKRIHLPFSSNYSDVYWRWSPHKKRYLRYYGDVAARLSNGAQISASTVVVQMVQVRASQYVEDATGARENYIKLVGSGQVYVFRSGRMVVGKWVRPSLADRTQLVDRTGRVIPLSPGVTWVELFPTTLRLFVR